MTVSEYIATECRLHGRRSAAWIKILRITKCHILQFMAQPTTPGNLNFTVYRSIDESQTDLDVWIQEYNEQRPRQGRWCFGKLLMQSFLDAMPMTKEKMIAA
jgi:hypothetical protein